jgi:hypothetical protein
MIFAPSPSRIGSIASFPVASEFSGVCDGIGVRGIYAAKLLSRDLQIELSRNCLIDFMTCLL